jgi:hypothetical protein
MAVRDRMFVWGVALWIVGVLVTLDGRTAFGVTVLVTGVVLATVSGIGGDER